MTLFAAGVLAKLRHGTGVPVVQFAGRPNRLRRDEDPWYWQPVSDVLRRRDAVASGKSFEEADEEVANHAAGSVLSFVVLDRYGLPLASHKIKACAEVFGTPHEHHTSPPTQATPLPHLPPTYVNYDEPSTVGLISIPAFKRKTKRRPVFLRAGCMCNGGGCPAVLGQLPEELVDNNIQGISCGSGGSFGQQGEVAALVRASFHHTSTVSDVLALERFLVEYVLDPTTEQETFQMGVRLATTLEEIPQCAVGEADEPQRQTHIEMVKGAAKAAAKSGGQSGRTSTSSVAQVKINKDASAKVAAAIQDQVVAAVHDHVHENNGVSVQTGGIDEAEWIAWRVAMKADHVAREQRREKLVVAEYMRRREFAHERRQVALANVSLHPEADALRRTIDIVAANQPPQVMRLDRSALDVSVSSSTCPTIACLQVMPVKGLSALTLARWPLTQAGLLFDRVCLWEMATAPLGDLTSEETANRKFKAVNGQRLASVANVRVSLGVATDATTGDEVIFVLCRIKDARQARFAETETASGKYKPLALVIAEAETCRKLGTEVMSCLKTTLAGSPGAFVGDMDDLYRWMHVVRTCSATETAANESTLSPLDPRVQRPNAFHVVHSTSADTVLPYEQGRKVLSWWGYHALYDNEEEADDEIDPRIVNWRNHNGWPVLEFRWIVSQGWDNMAMGQNGDRNEHGVSFPSQKKGAWVVLNEKSFAYRGALHIVSVASMRKVEAIVDPIAAAEAIATSGGKKKFKMPGQDSCTPIDDDDVAKMMAARQKFLSGTSGEEDLPVDELAFFARRYRPNIILKGVKAMEELTWPEGTKMSIYDADYTGKETEEGVKEETKRLAEVEMYESTIRCTRINHDMGKGDVQRGYLRVVTDVSQGNIGSRAPTPDQGANRQRPPMFGVVAGLTFLAGEKGLPIVTVGDKVVVRPDETGIPAYATAVQIFYPDSD